MDIYLSSCILEVMLFLAALTWGHEDVSPAAALSVQQPPVLGDLHLQSGLDVQQRLVLLGLSPHVSIQLHQLLLQHAHLVLVAHQLHGVAALGLRQGRLQAAFLQETKRRRVSLFYLLRTWRCFLSCDHVTMLSCDCSSISRPCSTRLRSVSSDLDVCIVSVLIAMSLFRDSICEEGEEQLRTPCWYIQSKNILYFLQTHLKNQFPLERTDCTICSYWQ